MFRLYYIIFLLCVCYPAVAQEICDNGTDDDNDGAVDLNDTDCECTGLGGMQNVSSIIPNPSFEQKSCCPTTYTTASNPEFSCANGWIQATNATVDYNHTCNYIAPGVTSAGLTPFPDGNGIAGGYFLEQNGLGNTWKEYIGSCLPQTMKKDTTYQLTFNIASVPTGGQGTLCNNGNIFYPAVDVTLYGSQSGNPMCNQNQMSTYGCPTNANPNWQVLGSTTYTPTTSWGQITITFTPSNDINGVMLGAPCNLPPDYVSTGPDDCSPYFLFDNLLLNKDDAFGTVAVEQRNDLADTTSLQDSSGCSTPIALLASTDTAGGDWQWYKNDTALVGETDSILQVSGNNYGDGTYKVRYTLGNNCETAVDTIISTSPIGVISDFDADTACFGNQVSFTDQSTQGNSSIQNWQWNFGDNTSSNSQNPSHTYADSGYYQVQFIVEDDSGCVDTTIQQVYQPDSLAPTITSVKDVSCFGANDGFIDLSVQGGIPPYDYSWSPGSGASQDTQNIAEGNYQVSVTDSNGCTAVIDTTITAPPELTIAVDDQSNVSCNGAMDGQVSVQANGGTTPYEYSLDGGPYQSSSTFTGLTQGNYNVIVRDDSACTDTQAVTITEPPALTTSISAQSNVSCHGDSDGQVSVQGSGGTSPYEYSLDGGPYQSSGTFNGLAQGNYNVIVRDDSACVDTQAVTITEPQPITIQLIDSSNISCYGLSDGEISVSTTGGAGSSEFSLNDGSFQNTGNFTGLPAGEYVITARDDSLCTKSDTFALAQPDSLSLDETVNEEHCEQEDGSITLTVNGGTKPYNYSWNPAQTGQSTISGLEAGSYNATITDAQGCTKTASYQVNHVDAPSITTSSQRVTCYGANDGQAEVMIDGNTAPYTVQWSNGGTNTSIDGLNGGIYDVSVSDTFGCQATDTANVFEPPKTTIDAGEDTTISLGAKANLLPTVGNEDYVASHKWQSFNKIICEDCFTTTVSTIETTNYEFIVTDQWNCTYKDSVTVKVNSEHVEYVPNAFSPDGDSNNDVFRLRAKGVEKYHMLIFDRWGELVYETYDMQEGWDGTIDGEPAQTGVYVYVIHITFKDNYTMQKQGSVTLIR